MQFLISYSQVDPEHFLYSMTNLILLGILLHSGGIFFFFWVKFFSINSSPRNTKYFFQMHVDPFEEIELAEKNAEQHRRSATEKDVRANEITLFIFYVLISVTIIILAVCNYQLISG